MAAARLVSVAALCSSGVLGLVMQSWLQLGMVVGELRRVRWWLVGGRFGLQLLCTFGRNPCSDLAGAGDGDACGCHILSWKHRREVCALLRLRPRLRRETSNLGSGDVGIVVCLPCWGHHLGVACGQGLGEDGSCWLVTPHFL
jgi:hypothetical protein